MLLPRFIDIDGKRYLWRDLVALLRAQATAKAEQPTLFPLSEDCRPAGERSAAERYQMPSLFTVLERTDRGGGCFLISLLGDGSSKSRVCRKCWPSVILLRNMIVIAAQALAVRIILKAEWRAADRTFGIIWHLEFACSTCPFFNYVGLLSALGTSLYRRLASILCCHMTLDGECLIKRGCQGRSQLWLRAASGTE